MFAWESAASKACGKPVGLKRANWPDLWDLVRVFAKGIPPGEERAAALGRTVERYVAAMRAATPKERDYMHMTPGCVVTWLNKGAAEAAAEEERGERQSGTRKASEPARVAFALPKAAGGQP